MCQRPRKLCGTQVCYLQEPLTRRFQPLISLQPLGQFLSNSRTVCPPYMQPYIPILKEIGPVVREIYVPENCPIFFTFSSSSSHRFTKVTLSQPKTPFPWIDIFQIWHTYKALCSLF